MGWMAKNLEREFVNALPVTSKELKLFKGHKKRPLFLKLLEIVEASIITVFALLTKILFFISAKASVVSTGACRKRLLEIMIETCLK